MANSKPSVSIGSACCQPSGVPALERAVGADRTKGGAPALAVGQSVAAVGAPPGSHTTRTHRRMRLRRQHVVYSRVEQTEHDTL